MRTELDFIGKVEIPKSALYGIHSHRARNNFPDSTPFHIEWYKALALVKRACYMTISDFAQKAGDKYDFEKLKLNFPESKTLSSLIDSCKELEQGDHFQEFIVPAVSGGAGTSINMNINEILTNLALLKQGQEPGEYAVVDPLEDANLFQSTNDVVPTALKVATMQLLIRLEESINLHRESVENKEKAYRNVLRVAYTQMQEAVPSTYGMLFSTYSDALSRDWWRISKCLERIKVVNLGGSAIGTSLAVPRYFVMEVVKNLQRISNLPVTRGENLADATNNLDSFVEVHGILKAHAVNLEKMAGDIRLLASDLRGNHKITIQKMQIGSSIMPGKINPVIPEFIISSAHKIYANDQLISGLAAQGCLDLNAYLPVIGHALLESLKLMIACNTTCKENLIDGLTIDAEAERESLLSSPSIATVLLPYCGYNNASRLARYMKENSATIFEANQELKLINHSKLAELLNPENILQGGFRLKDLGD